jgi:Holliday junction resolvase
MSAKSRRKGMLEERALVHFLQDRGFAAEKISGMYKHGPDLSVPLLGIDRRVEVKVRSHDFQRLYQWLDDRDLLIVRRDRGELLVILRLKLAAEIAAIAERQR